MIPALKNLNFFSIHSARFSTQKRMIIALAKCVHDKKKCVNFWENFHSEFRCANLTFDFLMRCELYDARKSISIDGVFAICHNQIKPLIILSQNRILWQNSFDKIIAKLFSIELLSQSWISKPTWICHFCDWLQDMKKNTWLCNTKKTPKILLINALYCVKTIFALLWFSILVDCM